VSCRVMNRGIGTVLLGYVIERARASGARLQAQFVPTEHNRIMYVTYRFAGFRDIATDGSVQLLELDPSHVLLPADVVRVVDANATGSEPPPAAAAGHFCA
jgi:predicted enzyme involved in methoxymalonyl-ACP biosynthesis